MVPAPSVAKLSAISCRLATIRSLPLARDVPELRTLLDQLIEETVTMEILKETALDLIVNSPFLLRHPDESLRAQSVGLVERWRRSFPDLKSLGGENHPALIPAPSPLSSPDPEADIGTGGLFDDDEDIVAPATPPTRGAASAPSSPPPGPSPERTETQASINVTNVSDFLSQCRASIKAHEDKMRKKREKETALKAAQDRRQEKERMRLEEERRRRKQEKKRRLEAKSSEVGKSSEVNSSEAKRRRTHGDRAHRTKT